MNEHDELQGGSQEEIHLPDIIYRNGLNKLDSYNWLSDLNICPGKEEIVEVRFKNTRKGIYRNVNNLRLETGDIVAVEASPGHDIGRVSMTGPLVRELMKKLRTIPPAEEIRKVYRKAKPADIIKWEEAKSLEEPTMLRSRQIAEELKLNMKIGDVEYQGDKTKAIFYYIADDRVDFRQLIRVLADEFRIRIEMRQIGARQEAGRIGGIGSCGRELCCATHITCFASVTTSHARYQDISLNPQKLAGQCGKLKCCLSYEVDCYLDAQKGFPPREIPLETDEGTFYFQKMEVHKGIYWYSQDQHCSVNLTALPVERVKVVREMNRKGTKPQKLTEVTESAAPAKPEISTTNDDSITRFDDKEHKKGMKHRNKRKFRKPDGNRNRNN
ncbi:MAG: regulatory iron-sulfur-containing complex subunit RicT [Bacteroidales bacterium]|jgi:cell fate regulator YaaT (PSP1 superfamily)|nr:regulatory iron-sulfur-containing complex subunit RicT [Bacteroidales bacterium]